MNLYLILTVGIILYLLIGVGVSSVLHEVEIYKKGKGEVDTFTDKTARFFFLLSWPLELGCLIGNVSLYYKGELANARFFETRPSNVNLGNISDKINDIADCIAQMHSIATKENPAGSNFHEFVRSDNLISLYADYLERFENLPKNLALKRSRFEIIQFKEYNRVINKINEDYYYGIQKQREESYCSDFFSSGIIEKDIKNSLKKDSIRKVELLSPLYDLIIRQGYTGEWDFTSNISFESPNHSKTGAGRYSEMIKHATIILKLEQLGIIIRKAGENWGTRFKFRLKSTNISELEDLIFDNDLSSRVDDGFFERPINQGLPRIFVGY